MARPVTLFTGQWADLPFETICAEGQAVRLRRRRAALLGRPLRGRQGAQGQELRARAAGTSSAATGSRRFAISNHLVGQAVCDLIDERHKLILPPDVWGDGEPEGVRKRAAQKMIDTAKACRAFIDAAPEKTGLPGGRERLHRLEHLAQHLRVPADRPEVLAEGLRRLRHAVGRRS